MTKTNVMIENKIEQPTLFVGNYYITKADSLLYLCVPSKTDSVEINMVSLSDPTTIFDEEAFFHYYSSFKQVEEVEIRVKQ